MIYLDNAATTKVSESVKQAMLPFFDEFYGNASSLHDMGQKAKEYLENARTNIAQMIGAESKEIYFTSGGSESDNWAIESVCEWGKSKGKNHIITSAFEHHAILNTLKEKEKQGFKVTYLPVYSDGLVRIEDLQKAITADTFFISIMFANNEIGTIQDIKEIGAICQKNGLIFHTDAVQALGHVPIDVKTLNIDLLSASAHKLHGPKGVGLLYCKKSVPLFNFITGGAQERGRRPGTENLAGIIGFEKALFDAVNEMSKVSAKEIKFRDKLFAELSKIPCSKINGDTKRRLPSNFNMSFAGIEGESLLLLLNDEGICASSGSACTSGSLDPSHVLLAIGLPHEIAHGSLRLTLSKYTTEAEIDEVIKIVPKVVDYLRKMSPVWDKLKKGVDYAI